MPSVARNTFYLTSALVGQKVLSFVYFTLLARFLGAELVGKYTFALAFTTIFSIITDLGLTPVLIREVARSKDQAKDYVRTIVGIKIILTILAYGSVLSAAYLLGHPPLTLTLIALAGVVMAFDAFHLTFYGVLRGMQMLKYEAVGMVAGQGITLLGGILALVLHLPVYAYLIALALGSAWNVLLSVAIMRRHKIAIVPKISPAVFLSIWRISIPFALSGIFVRVYSYIDTVLLQHMKGDIAVGWYSIPYKITYAFQFLPMALSAAVYPALSSAWRHDKERMRWVLERAIRYSILIALPITFGIAILAPEIILTIYGQDFANSILPLEISIFGLVFIFLYFPIGALLNATDRQSVNTISMGITMAANIGLNLVLIPNYGAVGASIAAVSTNAFLAIVTLVWAMKVIHIPKEFWIVLLKTLIAVGVMSIGVLELKQYIFWPLTIVAGGLIYGACLYLFGAVTLEDIRSFRKIFKKEEGEVGLTQDTNA